MQFIRFRVEEPLSELLQPEIDILHSTRFTSTYLLYG